MKQTVNKTLLKRLRTWGLAATITLLTATSGQTQEKHTLEYEDAITQAAQIADTSNLYFAEKEQIQAIARLIRTAHDQLERSEVAGAIPASERNRIAQINLQYTANLNGEQLIKQFTALIAQKEQAAASGQVVSDQEWVDFWEEHKNSILQSIVASRRITQSKRGGPKFFREALEQLISRLESYRTTSFELLRNTPDKATQIRFRINVVSGAINVLRSS